MKIFSNFFGCDPNAKSHSLRIIFGLMNLCVVCALISTNVSIAEDSVEIVCVEDDCETCEFVFFKRNQAWFDKKLMPMIGDISDNWHTINDDKNVLAIDLVKLVDGFFSHSVFWLDQKTLRFHLTKILIDTEHEGDRGGKFLASSGACFIGS